MCTSASRSDIDGRVCGSDVRVGIFWDVDNIKWKSARGVSYDMMGLLTTLRIGAIAETLAGPDAFKNAEFRAYGGCSSVTLELQTS